MQAKTGQEDEFVSALQRLRGKDSDISEEAVEIKVLKTWRQAIIFYIQKIIIVYDNIKFIHLYCNRNSRKLYRASHKAERWTCFRSAIAVLSL